MQLSLLIHIFQTVTELRLVSYKIECLSTVWVVHSQIFTLVFQQIVASDDEGEDDAEAAFLASLTDKQKKKLLR